jgi:hypothetical protein
LETSFVTTQRAGECPSAAGLPEQLPSFYKFRVGNFVGLKGKKSSTGVLSLA